MTHLHIHLTRTASSHYNIPRLARLVFGEEIPSKTIVYRHANYHLYTVQCTVLYLCVMSYVYETLVFISF